MTDLFDFLAQSVEYQNFDLYSAGTIGALGTVFFTFLQGWGLWKQFRNIETGESVSVPMNIYLSAEYMVFLIYGAYTDKAAMCFHGFLFIGHLLVLGALVMCKPFLWWEKAMLLLIPVLPYMMFFSRAEEIDLYLLNVHLLTMEERELIFLAVMLGTLVVVVLQLREILKKRSSGEVGFWMLLTYTAAAAFWAVYAVFGTEDAVLRFFSVSVFTLFLITLRLWFRYRPEPKKSVTK